MSGRSATTPTNANRSGASISRSSVNTHIHNRSVYRHTHSVSTQARTSTRADSLSLSTHRREEHRSEAQPDLCCRHGGDGQRLCASSPPRACSRPSSTSAPHSSQQNLSPTPPSRPRRITAQPSPVPNDECLFRRRRLPVVFLLVQDIACNFEIVVAKHMRGAMAATVLFSPSDDAPSAPTLFLRFWQPRIRLSVPDSTSRLRWTIRCTSTRQRIGR